MVNNGGNMRRKSKSRHRKSRSHKSYSKQHSKKPVLVPTVQSVLINPQKNSACQNRESPQQYGHSLAQAFNRLTGLWQETKKEFSSLSDNNSKAIEETGYLTGSICIEPSPPRLVFQCQLAHGSPTGIVADFNNPAELYKKIADCFDNVSEDQILFCTRNTHRLDMDALFNNTLTISDFLFAHLVGQPKEVELVKTKSMLGVTVADNGAGRVFVRRIDDGSVISAVNGAIEVGDCIEKINGESMVGKKHYQVAQILRNIELNQQFSLRLVSPIKNGFSFISSREDSAFKTKKFSSDANATIRFNKHGTPIIEEASNKVVTDRLNEFFAKYLGFSDDWLSEEIISIGDSCSTFADMKQKIQSRSIAELKFPTALLIDLWGIVNDAKKQIL